MSENDIKPVAWTSAHELKAVSNRIDGLMTRSCAGAWNIALYDQSAIDRLTIERDVLQIEKNRLQAIRQQLESELTAIRAECVAAAEAYTRLFVERQP